MFRLASLPGPASPCHDKEQGSEVTHNTLIPKTNNKKNSSKLFLAASIDVLSGTRCLCTPDGGAEVGLGAAAELALPTLRDV